MQMKTDNIIRRIKTDTETPIYTMLDNTLINNSLITHYKSDLTLIDRH